MSMVTVSGDLGAEEVEGGLVVGEAGFAATSWDITMPAEKAAFRAVWKKDIES